MWELDRGAHARLTLAGQKYAVETWRMPGKWLEAAEAGNGESFSEAIDRSGQATEFLLMGLRLSEGIDLLRYERLAGEPLAAENLMYCVS